MQYPPNQTKAMFDELNEIIQPLVDVFGINFFTYHYVYWDGSLLSLCNHPKSACYYFDADIGKYMSGLPNAYEASNVFETRYFFYDDFLTEGTPFGEYVLKPYAELFDICHITAIPKFSIGYTEIYSLGFPDAVHDYGQQLLANRRFMDNFITYFRTRARRLIIEADKYRVAAPPLEYFSALKEGLKHTQVNLSRDFDLEPERYYLDGLNSDLYLTPREADVIKALAINDNYGEVANQLGLSRQTVQQYADAVRFKLDLDSKADLVKHIEETNILKRLDAVHFNQGHAKVDEAGRRIHREIQKLYLKEMGQYVDDWFKRQDS